VLLGIVAAILAVIYLTPCANYIADREAIDELARQAKEGDFQARMIFVAISSIMIMVGTPRLIFFTFGSFAFGFWSGLFYSLCGCLAGSFLAFSFARWGARVWLTERFGNQKIIQRIVNAQPKILSIALLRFLPISNALVNIGLSLSSASIRNFLLGSLLGYIPQGILAALLGSGLAQDTPWTGSLQIGIAAVLLISMFYLTARFRRKQSPD